MNGPQARLRSVHLQQRLLLLANILGGRAVTHLLESKFDLTRLLPPLRLPKLIAASRASTNKVRLG